MGLDWLLPDPLGCIASLLLGLHSLAGSKDLLYCTKAAVQLLEPNCLFAAAHGLDS